MPQQAGGTQPLGIGGVPYSREDPGGCGVRRAPAAISCLAVADYLVEQHLQAAPS